MKACSSCRFRLSPQDKFCSRCGTKVKHKPSRACVPSNFESIKQLRALNEKIYDSAQTYNQGLKKYRRLYFVLMILSFFFIPYLSVVFFILLFGTILLIQPQQRWLTPSEYYSISRSKSEDGSHNCIFCDNKGIYKKGKYGTDNTFSMCSKCKKPLFGIR